MAAYIRTITAINKIGHLAEELQELVPAIFTNSIQKEGLNWQTVSFFYLELLLGWDELRTFAILYLKSLNQ